MEGVPLYPEVPEEDDEQSKSERHKKPPRRVPFLEWLDPTKEKPDDDKKKEGLFGINLFEKKAEEQENDSAEKPEASEELEVSDDTEPEIAAAAELDHDEEQVVSEQLVEERLERVEHELEASEPDSDEELEATVAVAFLDKIGDKLDQGEALSDESIEAAANEVEEELHLEPAEAPEETPEEPIAAEQQPEQPEPTQPEQIRDEDQQAQGQAAQPPAPPPPPQQPPLPPSGPNFNQPPPSPNILNAQTAAEAEPETAERRHSHAPYVLAGGLLGYLLGRRRGRIKTEKKLMPVQKKLEKNVGELNDKLLSKEDEVRRLAVQHKESLGRINRENVKERLEQEKSKRRQRMQALAVESPMITLEQNQDNQANRAGTETISDQQAIEVSKRIRVGSAWMEQLYRQGRLELKALREIVYEFLQNGDYETLIAANLKPESLTQTPEQLNQTETRPELQQEPQPFAQRLPQSQPEIMPAETLPPQLNVAGLDEQPGKQGIPLIAKLGVGGLVVLLVIGLAVWLGLAIVGAL